MGTSLAAVVARALIPSTWEAEAGGSLWVHSHPGLNNEFQDSQRYIMRPCLESSPKKFCLEILRTSVEKKSKEEVQVSGTTCCHSLGPCVYGSQKLCTRNCSYAFLSHRKYEISIRHLFSARHSSTWMQSNTCMVRSRMIKNSRLSLAT